MNRHSVPCDVLLHSKPWKPKWRLPDEYQMSFGIFEHAGCSNKYIKWSLVVHANMFWQTSCIITQCFHIAWFSSISYVAKFLNGRNDRSMGEKNPRVNTTKAALLVETMICGVQRVLVRGQLWGSSWKIHCEICQSGPDEHVNSPQKTEAEFSVDRHWIV